MLASRNVGCNLSACITSLHLSVCVRWAVTVASASSSSRPHLALHDQDRRSRYAMGLTTQLESSIAGPTRQDPMSLHSNATSIDSHAAGAAGRQQDPMYLHSPLSTTQESRNSVVVWSRSRICRQDTRKSYLMPRATFLDNRTCRPWPS